MRFARDSAKMFTFFALYTLSKVYQIFRKFIQNGRHRSREKTYHKNRWTAACAISIAYQFCNVLCWPISILRYLSQVYSMLSTVRMLF